MKLHGANPADEMSPAVRGLSKESTPSRPLKTAIASWRKAVTARVHRRGRTSRIVKSSRAAT